VTLSSTQHGRTDVPSVLAISPTPSSPLNPSQQLQGSVPLEKILPTRQDQLSQQLSQPTYVQQPWQPQTLQQPRQQQPAELVELTRHEPIPSPQPSHGYAPLPAGSVISVSAPPLANHTPVVQRPKREPPPVVPNTLELDSGVELLDPDTVHDLMNRRACILVDVRGDDRKVGLIPGAIHEPAIGEVTFGKRVPGLIERCGSEQLVVFTCQYSAHRGRHCANLYREQASPQQRVGVLQGGFRYWEACGLPVDGATESAATSAEADAYAISTGLSLVSGSA